MITMLLLPPPLRLLRMIQDHDDGCICTPSRILRSHGMHIPPCHTPNPPQQPLTPREKEGKANKRQHLHHIRFAKDIGCDMRDRKRGKKEKMAHPPTRTCRPCLPCPHTDIRRLLSLTRRHEAVLLYEMRWRVCPPLWPHAARVIQGGSIDVARIRLLGRFDQANLLRDPVAIPYITYSTYSTYVTRVHLHSHKSHAFGIQRRYGRFR